MQEEQIAQQLAQKLPKSEPELNPQYPDPEDNPETGRTGLMPLENSQLTYEMADYFNLGGARQNAEVQSQLNEIIQWAKQNAESPDLAGILRTLRHTETILGTTLKPDRMARLYRYTRIQQQKSLLAERERALSA